MGIQSAILILMKTHQSNSPITVGLFVTCLADLMRPQVAFAAVSLLEHAQCDVRVPRGQSCCGQPALNSGDRANSIEIAKQVITEFSDVDYVVVPSGSCADTLKNKYPTLFSKDMRWARRAQKLADKTWELTKFLFEKIELKDIDATFDGVYTYHDSCTGLRELSIYEQPRELLKQVKGLRLKELKDSNVCCGFGGLFSLKYPDISTHLVSDKCAEICNSDADLVLGGDLGCLLNIAGRLRRDNKKVRVFHIAEMLAGMTDGPAIGDPEESE